MKKTDPICGMKGRIPAHGYYFCSEYCLKKYEEEHNISSDKKYCPSCSAQNVLPWYKEKLYIIIILTVSLLLISYFVSFLNPFFYAFIDYLILID